MIYEALVVPTEVAPTLREIKRALLSYDRVLVIDPSDRELIPRNAYTAALTGFFGLGLDTGPVRPLGKKLGYDEQFARTMESCQTAISQNLLKVVSSFSANDTNSMTIGGVPLGGYPLNVQAVYQFYRGLASSQTLLAAALSDNIPDLQQQIQATDSLALPGIADGSVNKGPALPMADFVARTGLAEPLTQVARARIGAVIKYSGYCEAKGVIPVFGSRPYAAILDRILDQAREFLNEGTSEPPLFRRSRVLDLVHEEFLVDQRLDALTVQEVIELRTKAWGEQALARERLFESIFEIAEASASEQHFANRAALEIREYRKAAEAVLREREALAMSIKCDLGAGALTGGVALAGLLRQLESPIQSIAITLAAGGVWALGKAKEYVPKLRELQAQAAELKRGAGFAVHDFYSRLPGAD